jgi:hypothetical protein
MKNHYKCPIAENPEIDTNEAYNLVIEQLITTAKAKLTWRKTATGEAHKFTKIETLIHKGRKLISNLKKLPNHNRADLDLHKISKKLGKNFPDDDWNGPHINDAEEHRKHILDTWKVTVGKLYAKKAIEDQKRIVEAISKREDDFTKLKAKC